jgi:Zn-dependent protease
VELSLIQKIVIWALPLIFAITGHEVAHGWVAYKLGDPTAKVLGRLTLNPLKHIDLFGTILVPAILLALSNFVFGWAKPVPIDPRNFKHHRRDAALVAIAGPLTNLLMAVLWAAIGKLGMYLISQHNEWLGLPLLYMGGAGITINIVLSVLNLLPFPPLDGSKVIYSILPGRVAWNLQRYESMGFFLLMILWATGVLSFLLETPVFYLMRWITNIFGLNIL